MVNPKKIEVVEKWPRPTSVMEIHSFLGLAIYYRWFVKDFSRLATPPTRLTQKNVKFQWNDACEKSFGKLKSYLTSAPILSLPQGVGVYIVYYDASRVSSGCVLMQHGKVIAYASRQLKKHEQNYPINVIMAHFQVRPMILDLIKEAQDKDEWVTNALNDDLRREILKEAHLLAYVVHFESTKIYHDLNKVYWWESIKKDVAKFIAKCLVCQQVKVNLQRPVGLQQPLPILEWKWEHIFMDFVTRLPHTSQGYDSIWFIIDSLTKSIHFLLVKVTYGRPNMRGYILKR
ncbi:PREDICTED: uncharacterized protein LOC108661571 [Theobroma cacao]|uniref:Uncharacterized protein LOC108661571 n=1 Tax=Theobroma cacao TaxID=3641 RepID=A0AB32W3I3_THECC|nr:PREDICTED: uncharacterized protein LOC108661571 [Theobroma cacao]